MISLGKLSFSLPNDLTELQESLGGVGDCVQMGYSLMDTNNGGCFYHYYYFMNYDLAAVSIFFGEILFFSAHFFLFFSDVPTASLTFYSINCMNGEW